MHRSRDQYNPRLQRVTRGAYAVEAGMQYLWCCGSRGSISLVVTNPCFIHLRLCQWCHQIIYPVLFRYLYELFSLHGKQEVTPLLLWYDIHGFFVLDTVRFSMKTSRTAPSLKCTFVSHLIGSISFAVGSHGLEISRHVCIFAKKWLFGCIFVGKYQPFNNGTFYKLLKRMCIACNV